MNSCLEIWLLMAQLSGDLAAWRFGIVAATASRACLLFDLEDVKISCRCTCK